MHTFICIYRGKRITVQAETTHKAQVEAARLLKARKSYDVIVMRADLPVEPASL